MSKRTLSRGAIAGVIGATGMALWFLVIDVIGNQPLFTPAFVASVLAGRETIVVDAGLVVIYTIFHFLAFVIVGIVTAWILDLVDMRPTFLLGVVLGFLLFNATFYGGVMITGEQVIRELGWPPVLIGNLLAGVLVMGYLHFTAPVPALGWLDRLKEHPVLREGLLAGLLGAVAVALWFLVIDALTRQIFFTPAALGSALLLGAASIQEVQVTAATVILYSFLHVAAFGIVGIVAAVLVDQVEKEPRLLLGIVLLFVAMQTLFLGVSAIFAQWILDALAFWTVIAANLIAAAVMAFFLWQRHPKLRKQVWEAMEKPVELEERV